MSRLEEAERLLRDLYAVAEDATHELPHHFECQSDADYVRHFGAENQGVLDKVRAFLAAPAAPDAQAEAVRELLDGFIEALNYHETTNKTGWPAMIVHGVAQMHRKDGSDGYDCRICALIARYRQPTPEPKGGAR